MRTLSSFLALSLALLSACESNDATPTPDTTKPVTTAAPITSPSPTATTAPVPAPTTDPTAEATAAPSADATATPEPPTALLGRLALAPQVKLRRPLGGGEGTTLDEPAQLKAMREAIGMDQEPSDSCPRCIPSVQLVFEDATKTRLGSVGLFCDASAASEEAVLRDALAESCQSLKLADADALKKLVDEALPMAEEP